MDWESKLKELSNYNVAFEIRQGYYHISIIFQEGWDVILPDNECIYVEKRNDTYHYIASTDSVSINEIFDVIDNTIQYNKDLEKKLELFKQKTAELQELFSKENYEKLKTLEFTFPLQKKTNKKSKTKKEMVSKAKIEIIPVSDSVSAMVSENMNSTTTTVDNTQYANDTEEVVVTMKEGEYMEELEK